MISRGFVVHCYTDMRKDRLYFVGRLENGQSFAAVESKWQPSFHIYSNDMDRAANVLSSNKTEPIKYEKQPPILKPFNSIGELLLLNFPRFLDFIRAVKLIETAGIKSPDGDMRIPDIYCVRHNIKGPVELEGDSRPGRLVDLVFPNPEIKPIEKNSAELRIASVDIETDIEKGTILAIGIATNLQSASTAHSPEKIVRLLYKPPPSAHPAPSAIPASSASSVPSAIPASTHDDEASLLKAFLGDIKKLDPDIITGWNFLDFDYPVLEKRCALHKIPFRLGRSDAAGTQGRQILDALRIYRAGPKARPRQSYSLEAIARAELGEGKLLSSKGDQKISELKELYLNAPMKFAEYCLRDAELVLEILDKTGLMRLTVERASVTGVSLDRAWTSVISFERIYALELAKRGIAPVPLEAGRRVSGAAGGTVLEPMPGVFHNVAVFDFRSLYPTVMRTFNIDPAANVRVRAEDSSSIITAPNGAAFSRERGILPELLEGYFASRRRALEAGDEEASFVYKILMNSFYGVLGSSSCRYGRTELAGAITSFARKWLLFSRDWFENNGFKVLYGDTDSLFVETGLGDESSYMDFFEWGKSCAKKINHSIEETILKEYSLKSHLELRFEKPYRRFLIPPLRNVREKTPGEGRGRAKGYGGYLIDAGGAFTVEVKGMEAVRSDSTPLARRIQVELLELVFSGGDEEAYKARVQEILNELRQSKLDSELVYRKRLSRAPEKYTASTPPHVKAARLLGWKNRRGTVEYVWTIKGPEPLYDDNPLHRESALDYSHYADSQVLPVIRSIAAAAGWNTDEYSSLGRDYFRDGQMELF